MSSSTWRLILDPPAAGPWNMAVDEALLEAAGTGKAPTTLRLYAWDPACLSLGFAQPAADVDLPALAENGWQLVRRPTGGRAILHTDELTYAVIGPAGEPLLTGTVLESYARLSQALLAALNRLGLPARADRDHPSSSPPSSNGPVCFEVPSHYEITANGKKLIGSAQARRAGGVLQHGTLPLTGDLARITRALHFPDENLRRVAAQRVLERAVTADTVLGRTPSWQEAASAFIQAFQETFDLTLTSGELSAGERRRAGELLEEKFAAGEWTFRV